jgi:hypothetical protein
MKTLLLPRLLTVGLVLCLSTVAFDFTAHADQPHMQAALNALQTARTELQAAEHDKAGHREKALEMVDRAIEQTKRGLAAGV